MNNQINSCKEDKKNFFDNLFFISIILILVYVLESNISNINQEKETITKTSILK
jgi:hypothetical protein